MRAGAVTLALTLMAAPAPAAAQSVQSVPWAERQPTQADYHSTYPPGALSEGIEGQVRLLCTVTPARTLDCTIQEETPADAGFGDAALRLVALYVVREDDPRVAVGNRVIVPIRYVLWQ